MLLVYINYITYFTRVVPKVMPPVLLCWPMMSEADSGMAVEVEPPHQYPIMFCCCGVAAEGHSDTVCLTWNCS